MDWGRRWARRCDNTLCRITARPGSTRWHFVRDDLHGSGADHMGERHMTTDVHPDIEKVARSLFDDFWERQGGGAGFESVWLQTKQVYVRQAIVSIRAVFDALEGPGDDREIIGASKAQDTIHVQMCRTYHRAMLAAKRKEMGL